MKNRVTLALVLFFYYQPLLCSEKKALYLTPVMPGATVAIPKPAVESKEEAEFLRDNPKFRTFLATATLDKLTQFKSHMVTAQPKHLAKEGKTPLSPKAFAKRTALIQSALHKELTRRDQAVDPAHAAREQERKRQEMIVAELEARVKVTENALH